MTPTTVLKTVRHDSPPAEARAAVAEPGGTQGSSARLLDYRRSAVEMHSVTKSFGATVAVRELSLKVRERTVCGFIGPNGSGKTTTLRLMMRIYRPDEGAGLVRVLGHDDPRRPSHCVGYLPEERGLYNRMKVRDILRFYAELKGCPKPDAAVVEWLDRMDLARAAATRVEALSKGMAQKVQFITAVINKPTLVILDEPFSGLDPVNADALRRVILDLKADGTTVIYSTHDMHMAERMCDDIVMIYKGDKVLDGPLDEIKRTYGADIIRVRLSDDTIDLGGLPGVERVNHFGRMQELRLGDQGDAQQVLRRIVQGAAVLHFEIATPSLHDIFVRIAGPAAAEADHA